MYSIIFFMKMFPMIFQSWMGPRKSRCDVPSSTTQGHGCPMAFGGCGNAHKKLFPML
jgi:hypothetical protein